MIATGTLLGKLAGFADGDFLPLAQPGDSQSEVTDPGNGELLAKLPSYGAAMTTRMVEQGMVCLAHEPSLEQRATWLQAIAEAHLSNCDELAMIISRENGKPVGEARGEVEYAAGFYRVAAENIQTLAPRVLTARPKDLTWTVYARPAGVVGLITPWNFPLAMLAKKLAAAIAAGSPSITKPAEKTPLSAIALFELLRRLDLPRGFVSLVFGDSPAIGKVFCEHPAVRVISFTGSTSVGKILAEQAAPHVKRLTLELGGNAPFIVCQDADLDVATEQLMASKFRCTGQTCVAANRVFVHESVAAAFAQLVSKKVSQLRIGHGMSAGVQIGPMIDEAAAEKVNQLVQDAISKGAKVVARVPVPTTLNDAYVSPTVLADVAPGMALLSGETFGPIVPITTFANNEALIEQANDTEYGLAAYLFTRDAALGAQLASRLSFGHVAINSGTGPTPEAPFGGMKQSGYGREGGLEGLFEFTELQTTAAGSAT